MTDREEQLWEAFGNFCEAISSSLPKYSKMTVKQLKEKLAQYPDNMDVFVAERATDFAYGLVNSVRSEEITFGDWADPDFGEVKDTVVVIDEE